mmetsp:Transcript_61686/g.182231  ORF Transcript_61686/g.182231 Transcript_61686/m.182231 type:complete len:264 (-) Transcript_61686:139-930(-)
MEPEFVAAERNRVRRHRTAAAAAVVSGSEHNHETSDDESSDDGNASVPAYNHPDELFDENADEEDAAYVYKYMRGGTEEEVNIRRAAAAATEKAASGRVARNNGGTSTSTTSVSADTSSSSATAGRLAASTLERAKLLKPRSSDAVLSCPCCFSIVCMDCQRHERYKNQWRAMFVMNIGVDWKRTLVYDEGKRELVANGQSPSRGEFGTAAVAGATRIPRDDNTDEESEEFYYPVFCDNCKTEVAALNMDDEVYHFYGCIASA